MCLVGKFHFSEILPKPKPLQEGLVYRATRSCKSEYQNVFPVRYGSVLVSLELSMNIAFHFLRFFVPQPKFRKHDQSHGAALWLSFVRAVAGKSVRRPHGGGGPAHVDPSVPCLATGFVTCGLFVPAAQGFTTSPQSIRVQSKGPWAPRRRGAVFVTRERCLSTLFAITTCWLSRVVTKHLPYKHKTSCHSTSTHEEAKQYWNRVPELHAGFQYPCGNSSSYPDKGGFAFSVWELWCIS